MKRLLWLIVLALPMVGHATAAWQQLSDKLGQLQAFQASYIETIAADDHQQKQIGKFYWQSPNQFKCIVDDGDAQQILSDGKTLWTYDVGLEQVMIKSPLNYDDLSGLPALMAKVERPEQFKRYPITVASRGHNQQFTVLPADEQAQFQQLDLYFDREQLNRIVIKDLSGQQIDVKFRNIQVNQKQPLQFFQLTIPKGVDVVQMR